MALDSRVRGNDEHGWRMQTLKGRIHVKHGYPFKSEHFADSGDLVVLTPGNFWEAGGFKYQTGKEKFYDAEFPPEYLHKRGDLIVAMTEQSEGLLGSMAFVPENGRYLHNQRIGKVTATSDELNLGFLYYAFRMTSVRTQLSNTASGSKVRHTSPERIYDVSLPVPPVVEQQKIAATLSALDAKIDLNQRINAELEALAKTIYDYWFVQFDFPDAHGRPYKSSGGAMVWNDTLKREIPAGWEVVPLSRLVEEIKDGITPNAFDTATPYIGLEHIARKSIVLSAWATADKATSNKITFRKGDILFGKIRPYFHKVALAMMEGIASTDAIVMRPRQRGLAAFALETIFSDRFVETATASSTGSKMPRADWKVMRNYGVAIPGKSSSVADGYQKLFDGIASKIENNVRQNLELTQLRDWLLPLLMNGQVRVA